MNEGAERFSANESVLKKSQCASCVHVNGWNCKKLGMKRPKVFVANKKKCLDFKND